jgi:hypothetical protein
LSKKGKERESGQLTPILAMKNVDLGIDRFYLLTLGFL